MNEGKEYKAIDLDDKDDVQRVLTVLEIDAAAALNDALQYKYIMLFN